MELNDANAFYELASWYYHGRYGLPQDYKKAFELFNRGAELGSIQAHIFIANAYENGRGVEKKGEEKTDHHLMLAAIGGNVLARNMLGDIEESKRNMDRAMKHYMISARSGCDDSMKKISEGYKAGCVTKEECKYITGSQRISG